MEFINKIIYKTAFDYEIQNNHQKTVEKTSMPKSEEVISVSSDKKERNSDTEEKEQLQQPTTSATENNED